MPNAGVTRVGLLAKTNAPEPVSSDITPANCEEVVAANTARVLPLVVSVPAVGKVTLVVAEVVNVKLWPPDVINDEPFAKVSVALVAGAVIATLFMLVALATPRVGVVNDGDVAKTSAPEPVSSVTAAAKFDDDGVAKNVATLAANPETPVEIGKPVQFVNVPEEGVPRAGVTNVGEVAKTRFPEPVSSEITLAN